LNGAGTSANDVKAIEAILKNNNLSYSTVDSQQLNGMTELQLLNSQLLIIPGGNFVEIGNGLSPETTDKVRSAVQRAAQRLGDCGEQVSRWKRRNSTRRFGKRLGDSLWFSPRSA
jgi:hypothetical protein